MKGVIGVFRFAETNKIVVSVMVVYDCNRGSVDCLSVLPSSQQLGVGRELMQKVEQELTFAGCPKINLFIRNENKAVTSLYERLVYVVESLVALLWRQFKEH